MCTNQTQVDDMDSRMIPVEVLLYTKPVDCLQVKLNEVYVDVLNAIQGVFPITSEGSVV